MTVVFSLGVLITWELVDKFDCIRHSNPHLLTG